MQAQIIIGSHQSQEEFLSLFFKTQKIPQYYIYEFQDIVKIEQAREIKKIISKKIGQNEKRVILIKKGILHAAQNALLKTLEELSDNTFIIFLASTKEEFIPTILSRAKILRLESGTQAFEEDKKIDSGLLHVFSQDKTNSAIYSAFSFCEGLSAKKENKEIEKILLCARKILIREVFEKKNIAPSNFKKLVEFTFLLEKNFPLIFENNINIRLFLENSFLKVFMSEITY